MTMKYTHKAEFHDFGDTPTDYGKQLADKYGDMLQQRERKAQELYKEDLISWERIVKMTRQRNSTLEKQYKTQLKQWEEDCKSSFLGFLKKLLRIKKPKLKLLEIPPNPEWDYQEYMGKL